MSPDKPGTVTTTVEGRTLSLSNLDKVLFPSSGFTKGELIDYYVRVAPAMLAHVRDRPLTMKRFPNGVEKASFFEKHVPSHAPDWLHQVTVPSTAAGGAAVDYGVVCDLPSLVWAANLATIEFHVPLWHVGRRRNAPRAPRPHGLRPRPGHGHLHRGVRTVARYIADILTRRGLACRAKTSGSKGLQLYVPLKGRPTWPKVRDDAYGIATDPRT